MPVPDLEACTSFIYANRLIADRFAEKAEKLLELAQTVDDLDERTRIADLIQFAERQKSVHDSLAVLQERDMGVKCHCRTIAKASKTEQAHAVVGV